MDREVRKSEDLTSFPPDCNPLSDMRVFLIKSPVHFLCLTGTLPAPVLPDPSGGRESEWLSDAGRVGRTHSPPRPRDLHPGLFILSPACSQSFRFSASPESKAIPLFPLI